VPCACGGSASIHAFSPSGVSADASPPLPC
jgi:hypothetical protein